MITSDAILTTARRVREDLTTAVHQEPAKYDLLRGAKSAIEGVIAATLHRSLSGKPAAKAAQKSRARASLELLAEFCAENQAASSAIVIRDVLAAIYGSSHGYAKVWALTRLDDDNLPALTYVLTALLSPEDADERLYDVDLLKAFERHGAEKFFLEASVLPSAASKQD